jgi:hypothetical protein
MPAPEVQDGSSLAADLGKERFILSELDQARPTWGTRRRYVESPATYQQIVARIRAEYVEMPGMRLTLDQLLRLCGIDRSTCRRVLEELVTRKFLAVTPDGMYVRRE